MSRTSAFARSLKRRNLLLALAAASVSLPAWGQAEKTYPNKPIRLIVPFGPGGNTDLVARLFTKWLSDDLGQQVFIDNRVGAGGNIGVDATAKSAPDGYTLVYSTLSTYALNVGLYKKLPFDPVKDLAPIALTVQVPLILVVPAQSGIRTLAELISQFKAQPGKHNFGSAGNGTSSHIACHLFTKMANVDVQHVPYKGTGPALTDLLAGRISFMMDALSVLDPMIKAGKISALGVAVPVRMRGLPDVPTFDEAGLKGFRAYSWNAFWAPAGTPPEILDRFNAAVNKQLGNPAIVRQIDDLGVVPYPPRNRAETINFMASEYEYWVPVVRAMGVTVD
jgi:tripartite-type tricarboxylate transporter receptor subunit TctC